MSTASINAADAKEELAELINRVSHYKERIVLTRRGKEVAALVPIEDLHLLLESQSKSDLQESLEALQEARTHGTISLDELKEEMGQSS